MMDAKTDLLTTLLQCGSMDLDKLVEILDMGNDLFDDNILADLIDEHGSGVFSSFNTLMSYLMETIVYKLVAELDNESDDDNDMYRDILEKYWAFPFTNYLDSHFQLDCLDGWSDGTSKDQLLEELKDELLAMKEKGGY